jgi:uncharacterized protein (TIRG00374 family)
MKTFLKISFSAILIGAIIWILGGIHEVVSQITLINPIYIVPIVALALIDRGLMAYKWCFLLRSQGIRLPFIHGMIIYCASTIWGMFLPTTLGSDAIRAYSTSKTGIDSKEVVASIIVERFIGFFSSLILAILGLCLLTVLGNLGDLVIIAWFLASSMFLGAVFLFVVSVNQRAFVLFHKGVVRGFKNHRITEKLREFHETYRSFTYHRKSLVTVFGLTFIEQFLPIIDIWLVARGLGIEVGVLYFAAALPLALLIMRLPVSIDGIGVFEGMFVLLMSLAGLSVAQATAIAVVSRILTTLMYIPLWFTYVVFYRTRGILEQSTKVELTNGKRL